MLRAVTALGYLQPYRQVAAFLSMLPPELAAMAASDRIPSPMRLSPRFGLYLLDIP